MYSIRKFQLDLVDATGMSPGDVEHRFGVLRGARLLPNPGRGRASAALTAGHAGNILIGLAAETAVGCARHVVDLAPAFCSEGRFASLTFAETLESMIADPEADWRVDHIDIRRRQPMATIFSTDGGRSQFRLDKGEDAILAPPVLSIDFQLIADISDAMGGDDESESDGFTKPTGMAAALAKTKQAMDA